jgi:DNA polymerase-3 subunit gamma/tau
MLAFRPASGVQLPAGEAAASSAAVAPRPASSQRSATPASKPPELRPDTWAAVVATLDVQGAARQLATNCVPLERTGDTVRLLLDERGRHNHTRQTEEMLARALSRVYGTELRLQIEVGSAAVETPARQQARANEERLQSARRELEEDPTVRALQEKFAATLVPESLKPLN